MFKQFQIQTICLLLLLPTLLRAQQADNWGAFAQQLEVARYEGKAFRLQAAVRVVLIDTAAEAEIWARVDKKDKRVGFFYNMMDKPIREQEWQVYTIEGTIDKAAEYLVFGGLYSRQGEFYFDDFRLWIADDNGVFEEVPIPSGGFESDSVSKHWGYLRKQDGFTLTASSDSPYNGQRSACVNGSNFRQPPSYGNSDKVGKCVDVNGIKLYYETYGQGKPLLLLHGNSQLLRSEPNRVLDDLRTIRCPVLVMAGEHDIIKAEHTRGIASHIPQGRLRITPNEDHYFPTKNPKPFNQTVLEFLASAQ